jgi:hypothetical protein
MGWTFTHKPHGMTAAEFIKRDTLNWQHIENEAERPVIVAETRGTGCVAFAVRYPLAALEAQPKIAEYLRASLVPDADGSITLAELFLTRRARDPGFEFGYKEVSETMGPVDVVPPSFLKHLSAIADETSYAAAWRERCVAEAKAKATAKAAAAKIVEGVRIRFAEPIRFTGGAEHSEFIAVSIQRRYRTALVFRAGGGLYRIPARLLAMAEIVTNPEAA